MYFFLSLDTCRATKSDVGGGLPPIEGEINFGFLGCTGVTDLTIDVV